MADSHVNPKRLAAFPLGPEAALDLTQAILARTSGSPCQCLHGLACAFVDGELAEDQSSLVRSHLDHCAACSTLVAALTQSQTVLPGLAELSPGTWFTQRVLRATVHQPASGSDLHAAMRRLMHRPRIALEAAYLGAAAGLMGLYLPLPMPNLTLQVPTLIQPLSASAQRMAGQVVQAERRTTASLRQSLTPLESLQVKSQSIHSLWQRLSAKVRARLQAFGKPQATPAKLEEKKPQPANP